MSSALHDWWAAVTTRKGLHPAFAAGDGSDMDLFCADLACHRLIVHRSFPVAGASQANFARLMNSQAEKKSLSHALYPSNR